MVCKGHWSVGLGGGRPASFWVSSGQNFLDTCLHEKGKAMAAEKVGGCRTHWPAGRSCGLATRLPLSELPPRPSRWGSPWPYKYPYRWKSTHTPCYGDSTCKPPIISAVARCSLVRRVVRLWGPGASWPIRSPHRSSSAKALPESFGVR
jgi:hypothetical protein